jgi:hypothetical protein
LGKSWYEKVLVDNLLLATHRLWQSKKKPKAAAAQVTVLCQTNEPNCEDAYPGTGMENGHTFPMQNKTFLVKKKEIPMIHNNLFSKPHSTINRDGSSYP